MSRGGMAIALGALVLVGGCHSSAKAHLMSTPSTSGAPSASSVTAASSASAGASSAGASVAGASALSSASAESSGPPAASNPNSVGPPIAAQIGKAVTYPDGLAIALVSAVKFVPGAGAQGLDPSTTPVRLQIQITNGSKVSFNSSTVQVQVFAGPNVDQAGPITESAASSGPALIAAGQNATLTFEFAVPTADLPTISVTVTPNLTEADAMFTGQVTS